MALLTAARHWRCEDHICTMYIMEQQQCNGTQVLASHWPEIEVVVCVTSVPAA